ncbi:ribosome maturation factor RimM [Lederbergia citrea]|uniref:Ribosome maturation factor RimM n=1 Tax=Lederbergia citrea TaxID=2833581 RepID=A0A942Z3K7_9BACI|nr:ribosome maturation factor RimM [Lederbergia citrea]MBS4177145.1 ribosome maturation factor RimM [Lederbergia citrea]MBS4203808.1 ribosome maturation factor RimM [Lederbergia citrea]MBS4221607.1 ribosome maturation factor RimM [Lederbergia citrea]
MERWFNVGKIVNTHGIMGEVRVISKTDFPEERYSPGNLLHLFMPGSKQPQQLKVKSHRKHKNFDLLTFEGHSNINDVEKWKNGILKVSETQLEELSEGEYYFHEIIGCVVTTIDDDKLGKVIEILTPGANDVWVVKLDNGKEVLIPFIDEVVKDISIEEKRIIINPIEGLLE